MYCLANENIDISYKVNIALGEICVYVPYDFMEFLTRDSVEEKYNEFCKLVHQYVIPGLRMSSHHLLLESMSRSLWEKL